MTHEELQQLLSEDITPQPTPDPAWDYYSLWENLNKTKDEIDEIIGFISSFENGGETTDGKIRNRLTALVYSVEDLESYL